MVPEYALIWAVVKTNITVSLKQLVVGVTKMDPYTKKIEKSSQLPTLLSPLHILLRENSLAGAGLLCSQLRNSDEIRVEQNPRDFFQSPSMFILRGKLG